MRNPPPPKKKKSMGAKTDFLVFCLFVLLQTIIAFVYCKLPCVLEAATGTGVPGGSGGIH